MERSTEVLGYSQSSLRDGRQFVRRHWYFRTSGFRYRLRPHIQGRDPEGQRIPTYLGQPVLAEPLGQRLAIGKFHDAGWQIAIRALLAARDHLADHRQAPTK